jgi:23S rRNA pseudouridine2605 synthase
MHKAQPGQHRRPAGPAEGMRTGPMRIAKALARAGLCSRREAERWIELGRVSVNGEVLKSPARDVNPADRILVDGAPLPAPEPPRL